MRYLLSMIVAAIVTFGLILLMIALIAPGDFAPAEPLERVRLPFVSKDRVPDTPPPPPRSTPLKPPPPRIVPLAEALGEVPPAKVEGTAPANYGDFVIVVRTDPIPPESALTVPAPYRACFAPGEEQAVVSLAFSLDAAGRPSEVEIAYASHPCIVPFVLCEHSRRRYQIAAGAQTGEKIQIIRVLRPSDMVAENEPCTLGG